MIRAEAVEAALRILMSHVDYDTHKYLECDEEGGSDHYPELAADFIGYYEANE